jgi:hypothetical protein
MLHIKLNDSIYAPFLKNMSKRCVAKLAWREWETHEHPGMPATSSYTWSIKTTTQIERPQYIIVFFQTGQESSFSHNITIYKDNAIRKITAWINGEYFPHSDIEIDFSKKYLAQLYDQYLRFNEAYNGDSTAKPMLSMTEFEMRTPMFIIDCTKHEMALSDGPVDVKLEINATQNMAANTTALCCVINDKIVTYSPLEGTVSRVMN